MGKMKFDGLIEKLGAVNLDKQHSLAELIGSSDWSIDLDTKMISYANGIEFPIQIIGTYSFSSETWLWAWANEASNIPEELLLNANILQQYGIENNIEILFVPELPADTTDVHAIGMIASGLTNSSAYYAANFGEGIILVTIKSPQIDLVEFNEQARILTVFPDLISTFELIHSEALKSYLKARNYNIEENNNELIANKGNNIITATFDNDGRMTNFNGEIK